MAEILRQETWTEECLWILLTAILHRSRSIDFVIIIYDFKDWPSETRFWWSDTLSSFLKSCSQSFAFLTSSHCPINGLSSLPSVLLDVETGYKQRKGGLIKARTKNYLGRGYAPGTSAEGLSEDVRKEIIFRVKSFQGSFRALNTYLALLLQNFGLTTTDAIVSDIESSPDTETLLYKREVTALQWKHPKTVHSASSALSWMIWSVRPLRIEELGAAIVITFTGREMRSMLSIDMEHDLRNHLGCFVVIENRYARITSALARNTLEENDTVKALGLEKNSNLVRRYLHYISSILEDHKHGTWEKCLFQVSWRHQTPVPNNPSLAFLNYRACNKPVVAPPLCANSKHTHQKLHKHVHSYCSTITI